MTTGDTITWTSIDFNHLGLRQGEFARGVPEFHRCDQAQLIIPVFGNQLGLDQLAEQRPSVRVSSERARGGSEAVELEAPRCRECAGRTATQRGRRSQT
jgi:hypothetical protein